MANVLFLLFLLFLVIGSIYRYSQGASFSLRSRRQVTGSIIASIIWSILPILFIILPKDVSFRDFANMHINALSKNDMLLLSLLAISLIALTNAFFKYRLRFKGVETPLQHLTIEDTKKTLSVPLTGRSTSFIWITKKIYKIAYEFKAQDGKTYHIKKRIWGEKVNYLTQVLYDPANPKRNIPVPAKHVDSINF